MEEEKCEKFGGDCLPKPIIIRDDMLPSKHAYEVIEFHKREKYGKAVNELDKNIESWVDNWSATADPTGWRSVGNLKDVMSVCGLMEGTIVNLEGRVGIIQKRVENTTRYNLIRLNRKDSRILQTIPLYQRVSRLYGFNYRIKCIKRIFDGWKKLEVGKVWRGGGV